LGRPKFVEALASPGMDADGLLELFEEVARGVRAALDDLADWGPSGRRAGQYQSDLAADSVAVGALLEAGLGVLSEESGLHEADRDILVVVDPVDGSTNAAAGIPWFATSLCALDDDGPLVALVVNQADGTAFTATRGGGAFRNGRPIGPSTVVAPGEAIVGISGYPAQPPEWRQFRALGAAALDLCAVADGVLDAYIDCSVDAHGPWDYLGGLLVCVEAGAVIVDAHGRDLVCREHACRRTPIAAGTPELAGAYLSSLNAVR
jgi:myo-inositol-1(or 4)-monophosphatase